MCIGSISVLLQAFQASSVLNRPCGFRETAQAYIFHRISFDSKLQLLFPKDSPYVRRY